MFLAALHIWTTIVSSSFLNQVDSAFYPPWDGKMSTSQKTVMPCGWEGNRRPAGKLWQPNAGWVT